MESTSSRSAEMKRREGDAEENKYGRRDYKRERERATRREEEKETLIGGVQRIILDLDRNETKEREGQVDRERDIKRRGQMEANDEIESEMGQRSK